MTPGRTRISGPGSKPSTLEDQRRQALNAVAHRDFDAALALLPAVAAQLPDDPVVRLALAEASWGTGDAAGALPHFEAALAHDPDRLHVRARRALALLAAEHPAEALEQLETVIAALPLDGPIEAMAAPFVAPLAFEPAAADAVLLLGQILLAGGALELAIAALHRAVATAPVAASPRLVLGAALALRGETAASLECYQTAVRLDPDEPLGWTALERSLRALGQTDEAETYAVAALGLSRDFPDRELLVGNALLTAGAPAEARTRFVRCMANASWTRDPMPDRADRLRVGVLAAPGRANMPLDFILDRAVHGFEIVLMLEDFAYPHDRIAARYDVLFNAVADPDAGQAAVQLAAGFAARVPLLPIANPPRAILDTTRERVAARLTGIAGCDVPATGRYSTRTLGTAAGVERALAEIGLPLLARPVGSHGGARLERIDTADALGRYVAWAAADELYLTRYHEFRSADGRYRKYRFIHVDGELLPYHLAIGDDWLVHYFRTGMAADATLRDEEAAFLASWADPIGPSGIAALREIGARIALDYCGIDCAVQPDGRLLLFECNAAMLVRHTGQPAMFDYKRAPAERIRDAVSRMLARRAAAR
ncbi:MAG: tetratricopeptide repeat protein [Pseudomonadota bacterium]